MSAIKPGDLVFIVNGACPHTIARLGGIETVTGFEIVKGFCSECSMSYTGLHANILPCYVYPLAWLKKIEPLDEAERTERTEEVVA